jgi:hypothetical protein
MGIDNHNMEIYYSILHFQDIFDEKRICDTVLNTRNEVMRQSHELNLC